MTGFVDRHFWKILAGLWAMEVALLLFFACEAIAVWKVGDPDDQLRIVQVRDWLAGQGWADVHQYRMSLPAGGDMHWSRLPDLPLGLAIASLTPLVGQAKAELWAAIVIPMLTLGIFLFCYARLVRTHFGSVAAMASTAGLLTAVPVIVQLVPLRVDHHGWQLVCMILCMTFLLDRERPVRSAILLGIVSAIWLEISIEALPYVAAFIGVMGCRWLFDGAAERSPPLSPFNIMVASTALASATLLLAMKPLTSFSQAHCDAVNGGHVAALLACAIASTAALSIAHVRGWQPGLLMKLLIGGFAAVAAATALWSATPQCLGDSFESLDPLVRRYWFDRTSEGLPIFHLGPDLMAIAGTILLLGIAGLVHLIRSDAPLGTKIALTLTFAATAFVGAYISRTFIYFIIVASIVLAPLAASLFASISEEASLSRRMLIRISAIALLLPFMTGQLVANGLAAIRPAPASTLPPRFAMDYTAAKLCQDSPSIEKLRKLPPSNLLVGLDAAPGILQHTAHRVVASGHHRNQPAMRDVITAFTTTPDELARVLKARKIDFVVVCAAAPEFVFYGGMNPEGNWARLKEGARFDMLVEQPGLGPYRIWKVSK